MVITCPACGKEHILGERSIPEGVKKVRCSFCHESFDLRLSGENVLASPPPKKIKKPWSIGISLSKGGVGKTTTSVNLAAGLSCSGQKILLVDTDTQGQDAYHLGVNPKYGLADFITGKMDAAECICPARKNLWLLAGGRNLAGMKQFIERQDFGGEKTLGNKLREIENDFDFVLVDTSPGWDSLTINVLFYVDKIVVPVSLEAMSLQGLSEFEKSLTKVKAYRENVALQYILPTFFDPRIENSSEILEKLSEMYGDRICAPIRSNGSLAEAPAVGKTIYEYAPGSIGSKDYRFFTEMILKDHETQGEDSPENFTTRHEAAGP